MAPQKKGEYNGKTMKRIFLFKVNDTAMEGVEGMEIFEVF